MKNLLVQQGETLRLSVEVDDAGAVLAEFIATDGVNDCIVTEAEFVDLVADVSTNDTAIAPGEYQYYIRVTWDDDTVDILPDPANCSGGCPLPTLTICEIPGVS